MYLLTPMPALRPFVRQLWIADSNAGSPEGREHVLPTGDMHLVFRLSGPPLRVFAGPADSGGSVLRGPVVGGVRTAYYAKESAGRVLSAGVQLQPGAALALFGVSAAELAGRHTSLSELWGGQADSAWCRIAEAGTPHAQLAALEAVLAARLPRVRGMHPAVASLLAQFEHGLPIETMVRDSRYSHRAFIALFRQATGLSPKRYARLLRSRSLLAALKDGARPLAELALEAGYSDQAHMQREFRVFAGLTPGQYRRLAPLRDNHVLLQEVKNLQDRERAPPYSEAFPPHGVHHDP